MRNTIEIVRQQSFMETHLTAILLTALVSSAFAIDECLRYEDLHTAADEMRTARYFTFVTLVNMVQENLTADVTFLMPHDGMISTAATMTSDGVLDFVLAHSIPSLLLFDDLKHLPTGSTIPTSKPGFVLRISNNGRNNYHLNNVRLVSINICMHVSTVRCHGIDGVLWMPEPHINQTISSRNCSSSHTSRIPPAAPPGSPARSNQTSGRQSSDATNMLHRGPISMITTCLMILLTGLSYKA